MTEFVRMHSRPPIDDARRSPRGHDGAGETPVALIFALTLVFFLFALGASQVTERSRAIVIVRAAVASLTDIDILIADNGDLVRDAAAEDPGGTMELTGYPIEITLSNAAVIDADDAELRAMILGLAAEKVYDEGPDAFAEGEQDIGFLTAENFLRFMLNQLTGGFHTFVTYAAVALGGIASLLAAHVVRKETGHRKFTVVGIFTASAGLITLLVTFVAGFVVGQFGGSDEFSRELRDLALTMPRIWRIDAFIVIVAGIAIALVGIAYRALAGAVEEAQPAYDYEYIDFS